MTGIELINKQDEPLNHIGMLIHLSDGRDVWMTLCGEAKGLWCIAKMTATLCDSCSQAAVLIAECAPAREIPPEMFYGCACGNDAEHPPHEN